MKSDWNPRADGGETLRKRFRERGLEGQTNYLTPGMLGPCFEVPAFLMKAYQRFRSTVPV